MILVLLAASVFVSSASSPSAEEGARFGHCLATADVNGDGHADLLVGVPDAGALDAGRVYVYLGSAAGPAAAPAWTKSGPQAGAHFGASAARAGDVNGDGFDDVVVGAPGFDGSFPTITSGPGAATVAGGRVDTGAVFLYLGSAGGLAPVPALVVRGQEIGERFGTSVGAAGDVDGDGFDDVLAGAPGTGLGLGSAVLFRGSPLGPASTPSWCVHGDQTGARFGFAVSGCGDFDGDGFDEVAVGAPTHDHDVDFPDVGRVFLYRGSAAGLGTIPFDSFVELHQGDARVGSSLAAGGDLFGSGIGTLLMGMPGADIGSKAAPPVPNCGMVWAIGGWPNSPHDSSIVTGGEQMRFGTSVSSAGDTNGDGLVEAVSGGLGVLGGMWLWSPGHSVAFRSGSQSAAQFGFAVAGGDVDGDGFADVLVSEPAWDGAALDEGRVVGYRGSPTGIGASPSWILTAP